MLNEFTFREHVRKQQLFTEKDRLLLAVSGGVDSVVLCDLCLRNKFDIEIAHVNFSLRGRDSDDDEEFVRAIAAKYHMRIHVRSFDTEKYAAAERLSIQAAARKLRYAWFDELLEDGLQWLLTAHHRDDNIETVTMNFFRGTGMKGLRGILPRQGSIIRPLLPFSKEEILRYATVNELLWREDASNSSEKYTRNYFRNTIIPMVAKSYPEVESNLSENISRFADAALLYDQAIAMHKKSLVERKGSEFHIPVLKLKKTAPVKTVLYELVKEFGFTSAQLPQIIDLFDADQAKYIESATHRVIKDRRWLIIAPIAEAAPERIFIHDTDSSVSFGQGVLHVARLRGNDVKVTPDPLIAYIDARELKFPLLLRRRRAGDYFYPLGMKKKKKLSRFLIDEKLSPTVKENIWVLESSGKICWIAGMRIDERFKITGSTKTAIRITLQRS